MSQEEFIDRAKDARVQKALVLKPHVISDRYVLSMCKSMLNDWKSALYSFHRLFIEKSSTSAEA
jgi:hypothetical protein